MKKISIILLFVVSLVLGNTIKDDNDYIRNQWFELAEDLRILGLNTKYYEEINLHLNHLSIMDDYLSDMVIIQKIIETTFSDSCNPNNRLVTFFRDKASSFKSRFKGIDAQLKHTKHQKTVNRMRAIVKECKLIDKRLEAYLNRTRKILNLY